MTGSFNNDVGVMHSGRKHQQSDSSISSAFLAQQLKATGQVPPHFSSGGFSGRGAPINFHSGGAFGVQQTGNVSGRDFNVQCDEEEVLREESKEEHTVPYMVRRHSLGKTVNI